MEERNDSYFELLISEQVPNILLHQSRASSFQEDSRAILLGKLLAEREYKQCTMQAAISVCAYLLTAEAAETIRQGIKEKLLG